jgi:lipid-binding SYLF domain-containing protein
MKSAILCLLTIALSVSWAGVPLKEFDDLAEASSRIATLVLESAKPEFRSSHIAGAQCLAVFPGYTHSGFLLNSRGGRGLMSCRIDGGWSAPVPVSVKDSHFGFFVGIRKSDIILPIPGATAEMLLKESRIHLKGPNKLEAFSRPGGGEVVLATEFGNGTLVVDKSATARIYGSYTAREILTSSIHIIPGKSEDLVKTLNQLAPRQ